MMFTSLCYAPRYSAFITTAYINPACVACPLRTLPSPSTYEKAVYRRRETEREGFEPSVQLPAHRISSAVP